MVVLPEGMKKLPVLARDMADDKAVILMVDSNIQRENLLPSEKAFAYKMKLETMPKIQYTRDGASYPADERRPKPDRQAADVAQAKHSGYPGGRAAPAGILPSP